MTSRLLFACLAAGFALPLAALAEESTSQPRPIPLTRPEMKQYLEDMKQRTPRIPLPPLSPEEEAAAGDRSRSYESRLRQNYLPRGNDRFSFSGGANRGTTSRGESAQPQAAAEDSQRRSFGRENEPGMTLDYKFKTSLFWIVSRTNNCQYCLGHQESKLLRAGMSEDEIASLDCNWESFTPAEQAAFAFCRRFTLEPHKLGDADIAGLKKHFTEMQILEMILSMAGNNSINRWKEGVGVPQSAGGGGFGRSPDAAEAPEEHSYLTPTSEAFLARITLVAPVLTDPATGKLTRDTVFQRPPLESRSEVEKALATARHRTPRLPLVDEAKAREILADDAPDGPLPQWMRLLANFPQSGRRLVTSTRFADEQGDLSPLLKAQVSWIIARQDRAWYAAGQARQRLQDLGQTDEQVFALDGEWGEFAPRERAMFTVARNLAASPVVLTDDEVAQAVKLAGPRDVVQLISYATNRASFNRITEAAGLALE